MPTGKPGSGRQPIPRPFWVFWDKSRQAWGVVQGARAHFVTDLCIQVTVTTQADQQHGVGVVRTVKRGQIVITA